MIIIIKTPTGQVLHFQVESSDTVCNVKDMFRSRMGIPSEYQRLIFAGDQLDDDCKLSDYNIQEESTLYQVYRLKGGGDAYPEVPVETSPRTFRPDDWIHISIQNTIGKTITLEMAVYYTIKSLKTMIRIKKGIPTKQQNLTFQGRRLEDHWTLQDYNISDASTVNLRLSWALRLSGLCFRALLACIRGGEKPVEAGKRRVRWICFSCRRIYDDFSETYPGAAKDIQCDLRRIYSEPTRQYILFLKECQRYVSLFTPPWMDSEWCRLTRLTTQLIFTIVLSILIKSFISFDFDSFIPSASCAVVVCAACGVSGVTFLTLVAAEDGSMHRSLSSRQSVSTQNRPDAGRDAARRLDDELDIAEATHQNQTQPRPLTGGVRDPPWVFEILKDPKQNILSRYLYLNARQRNYDFALFCGLREKYSRVSSWWQRFFTLKQVSAVRFVQFNITGISGDVRVRDIWPPEHNPRIWVYEPYPATSTEPLVGPDLMLDLWRNPHHADAGAYEEHRKQRTWTRYALEWLRNIPSLALQAFKDILLSIKPAGALDDDELEMDFINAELPTGLFQADPEQPRVLRRSRYVLERVPRLNQEEKLDISGNPEAWGLEVEEAFYVHRGLFLCLLIYTTGSVIFLVWLFKRYGISITSLSSISMAGWIVWSVSYAGLTITVWFKWAENS